MNDKLSLSELQQIIRDSLYIALPDMYWVIAEISEIKENYSGHCYLELVEKHNDEKNIRARIKAVIWSNRYRFLKSLFENITGESLQAGHKILVKAKIEYHELYGLSLVISDIDPAFTIGDMAIRRQLVIKQLEEEGVFSMNKELSFPSLPQRIAVISSKNAAGYTDFLQHLKGNTFGYSFFTFLFETPLQGVDTEDGVVSALDKVALNSDLFDVVAVIRGGGSQTDLSWFDSYKIAYHITQFPLPVVTGIGHEKDFSVTDMVANRSLKTPTAVADMLIECVADAERMIIELTTEIKNIADAVLRDKNDLIESAALRLLPIAKLALSEKNKELSGKILEMVNLGKGSLSKASHLPANQKSRLLNDIKSLMSGKESVLKRESEILKYQTISTLRKNSGKLIELENTMHILKPENILRRGYTITSINGKIIKKSDQLKNDEIIDTEFSDGLIKSKIVQKNNYQEK